MLLIPFLISSFLYINVFGKYFSSYDLDLIGLFANENFQLLIGASLLIATGLNRLQLQE